MLIPYNIAPKSWVTYTWSGIQFPETSSIKLRLHTNVYCLQTRLTFHSMTYLHLQQIEKCPQKIFKIVCEFDRVRRLRFQQFTHELFFISFMFDMSVNCRYYSRPADQPTNVHITDVSPSHHWHHGHGDGAWHSQESQVRLWCRQRPQRKK